MLYVLLDRVQLLAWPRGNRLPEIPGFSVERDTLVRRQTSIKTYRRVRTLRNHKTGTAVFIQYHPAAPWLAPLKITIVTEAQQGLSRSELSRVTAAFERFRFLLLEFAIDFAPDSGIGRAFVLLHALFGRSELQPANQHATIRFGTRKSEIMARVYAKPGRFRAEIEAHSRWLLSRNVSNLEDLARLPALLLPKHLAFFNVNYQRLHAHLSRKDQSSADRIVAQCREHATLLHGLLKFMREDVGLKNVRRFLQPLPLNEGIKRAAFEWAEEWSNDGK